jgi:hypothetical protein
MNRYTGGVAAGAFATVVLSALMVLKGAFELAPGFDLIRLLSGLLGDPGNLTAGWIAHALIGTFLWGLLFAALAPAMRGGYTLRGLVFATGAWVLMMVILMPMAGLALFGMAAGWIVPVFTLALHWVYGAVLGASFEWFVRTRSPGATGA